MEEIIAPYLFSSLLCDGLCSASANTQLNKLFVYVNFVVSGLARKRKN